MNDDLYRAWQQLEKANAQLAYGLRVFGDHLAEANGYEAHTGLDAVHFYLCVKYGWLPSVVRAMSMEDLRFMLEEEMSDWRMPLRAQNYAG